MFRRRRHIFLADRLPDVFFMTWKYLSVLRRPICSGRANNGQTMGEVLKATVMTNVQERSRSFQCFPSVNGPLSAVDSPNSGGVDACSDGTCQLLDPCSSDSDCASGLHCTSCDDINLRCVRDQATNPFQIVNGSLPFNKYSFLTTHNSFAIDDGTPRLTFTNQEDSITQQLNDGVRGFMLDTYDFKGDVWLCHSTGGQCYDATAFGPAIDTLKEIEAFLSTNPSEIVTLILEDYVHAPNGLTNVFTAAGLMKYWFPLSKMPKNGGDWPLVSDMVANNQRLLVFTSISSKEQSEGIAYEWNYIVENQYGDGGMHAGSCPNRAESSSLNDLSKSLVLENFFRSIPVKLLSCVDNSDPLSEMIKTCYAAAGNRWANFLAVDFYKRSDGGGAFQDVDTLNGGLICNCNDIRACQSGATPQACNQSLEVHL